MKQVLIRRGNPIVVDVPAPERTDNTMLVDVRCSLISTGTEVAGLAASPKSIIREALHDPSKVRRGLKMIKDTGLQRTMAVVNSEIDWAVATGYSCAGLVIECGKNVRGFAAGDLVACAGAGRANHAEIIAVPQNLAVRVPDGCDLESAASATLGAIAVQGVRRADVRFGEIVAVVGLGLIGQLTVQLLRAAGSRVAGTDVDADRVALAKKFGMTAGTDSRESDPVAAVKELSSGMGADAVIVTASSQSPAILQQAIQMVRRKGRVVVVGAVPLEMQRSPLYEKEADILISCSYGPGRYDSEYEDRGLDYPYSYVRWTENRNMAEYLRLVAEGRVDFRSLIEKTWPISEAAAAYEDLKENKRIAVLLSMPASSPADRLKSRVDVNPGRPKVQGRIRTGIVGPGSFARAVHLPNMKRLAGQYRIEAIASGNGSTAWNVARQYEARYASTAADDLFKDAEIDLIVIANRHHMHAAHAAAAARQGKAVLLEKPAALHAAELDELLAAVRESGTPFMVGFNRRFAPLVQTVKSIVGQRSNPIVITYRMNAGPLPADSWILGPEGGGRIIGEACHIFDLFNYLTGSTPVDVIALPVHASMPHISKTDNFSASIRYSDGSLCTLNYTSLGSAEFPKEAMEIFFEGKTIVLDDYRQLHFYGMRKKPVTKSQQDKGHFEELRQFANYLQGNGPSPMTLEEIESATRISFAVNELVRHGAAT